MTMRRLTMLTGLAAAVHLAAVAAAEANPLPMTICGSHALAQANFSTGDPGAGLSSTHAPGLSATTTCPENLFEQGLKLEGAGVRQHGSAGWKLTAPAGIVIRALHIVNAGSGGVGDGEGWWGEFYWSGGPGPAGRSGPIDDNFRNGGCCSQTDLNSQSMGWFMACGSSFCSKDAYVDVGELDLTAEEKVVPTIFPSSAHGLWSQAGWVRGKWDASVSASDPSGVCDAFVKFGSLPPFQALNPDPLPDRSKWRQCPEQGVFATVDTAGVQGSAGVGEGQVQLSASADNAAGGHAQTPTKTVYVDNSAPALSLSGPTDAPSTAGTQYVTATATGGPSGIASISCSVDNAAEVTFPGESARVPVNGVGRHSVTCSADNNAVDSQSVHGRSVPQSFTMSIRQPTIMGISFSRLVDDLRCKVVRERIRVPSRWITVEHAHQRVRVRTPAFTRAIKLTRCRPDTARRRIITWITVRRPSGLVRVKRTRIVRVVLAPRVISSSLQRVAHGHSAVVSGWLGTADGNALGGQAVQIRTAPDDGAHSFTQAAATITAPNGSWSVRLPAGPSRLVQAGFGGGPFTEPGVSSQVVLSVLASVRLRIRPTHIPWGSSISISGRIFGGYIPRSRSAVSQLLRLRIGIQGISQTAGIPELGRDGRFHTTYCFNPGHGVTRFWFSATTLNEADYPYSPASSRRVDVTVGPGSANHPC